MTTQEAIETLKVHYPDACYEQLREAVNAAIIALSNQARAADMLKVEKTQIAQCESDYRNGRISAFYDALGIDYSD